MAFSLREFIKKGLLNAVGNLPDYQIILNAAGWLEKNVLTETDLAEIQAAIDAKNAPPIQTLTEQEPEETDDGDGETNN